MLHISASLVNGGLQEWDEDDDSVYHRLVKFRAEGLEGQNLVDRVLTDDIRPPPQHVEITGTLADGTAVEESIYCGGGRRGRW